MATRQEVITFLNDKLTKSPNTTNGQWYVGIASDVKDRLFSDHNVSETEDIWAYKEADTDEIARSVEQHFLNTELDGGPGGGDEGTRIVYVYLKSSRTKP